MRTLRKCHGLTGGGVIRIALMFAWLFAGLHVSLHDWDNTGSPVAHDECQICRINQLPAAPLAAPSVDPPAVTAPVMLLASRDQSPVEPWVRSHRARAPPLS